MGRAGSNAAGSAFALGRAGPLGAATADALMSVAARSIAFPDASTGGPDHTAAAQVGDGPRRI
jgi:hypothetical protein